MKTFPALDDAARDRWSSKLKRCIAARDQSQKTIAAKADLEVTALNRFVKGQEQILRAWFEPGGNASRLAEALGVSVEELHGWLLTCAAEPVANGWHPAFPEVSAEAVIVPPPLVVDGEPSIRSVDAVVVRAQADVGIRRIEVQGPAKSGRTTLVRLLRDRFGEGQVEVVDDEASGGAQVRWLSNPGTLVVRPSPWGRRETEALVDRLEAVGALSGAALDRARAFVRGRLAESELWLGPRRRPVDVIARIASLRMAPLPQDLAEGLRQAAESEWERLVEADGSGTLATLPGRFPYAFWAAALRRPPARAAFALSSDECAALVDEVAGLASPAELRAALETIAQEKKAGDRHRLLQRLPRWGGTGAAEVVDQLVTVGFLESVEAGALISGDFDMACLWAAIGTAEVGVPVQRLGSPDMIALARWWPALGVTLDRLESWLAPCPPQLAIDAGRVLVSFAAALTREAAVAQARALLGQRSRERRARLAGLWAAAVCGVASVPLAFIGERLSLDVAASFPVASRRLAALLPPLDPDRPYEDLRRLLPPGVARRLRAWEALRDPAPEGWDPRAFHVGVVYRIPDVAKDAFVGALCLVQTFPRASGPGLQVRWGAEDFAALEDAATAGNEEIRALLAGRTVISAQDGPRGQAVLPPAVHAEHPWTLLPAALRLRWLVEWRIKGTSVSWELLVSIASQLREPVDVDHLEAACKAIGVNVVEERLLSTLSPALPYGGWPFDVQVVIELARRLEMRNLLGRVESLAADVLADYPVRRVPGGYKRVRCWVLDPDWNQKKSAEPAQLWDLLEALDALGQRAAELLHALGDKEALRHRAATLDRLTAGEALRERLALEGILHFERPWPIEELAQVELSDEAVRAQIDRWRSSIPEWEQPLSWSSMVDDPRQCAGWLLGQPEADRRGPSVSRHRLPIELPLDIHDALLDERLMLRAVLLYVALHEAGARDLTPEVRAWIAALPHPLNFEAEPHLGLARVSEARADDALRALARCGDRAPLRRAVEARLERLGAGDEEALEVARRWVMDLDRLWRDGKGRAEPDGFLKHAARSGDLALCDAARWRALDLEMPWALLDLAPEELSRQIPRLLHVAPVELLRERFDACCAASEKLDEATLLAAELGPQSEPAAAAQVVRLWLDRDDLFCGRAAFGLQDGLVVGGVATRLRLTRERLAGVGAEAAEPQLARWWTVAPDAWDQGWRERLPWAPGASTPFDDDANLLVAPSPRHWLVQTAFAVGARRLVVEWGRAAIAESSEGFALLRCPDPGSRGAPNLPFELLTCWAEDAPVAEVAATAEDHPDPRVRDLARERLHRDAPQDLLRLVDAGWRNDPNLLDWAVDLQPEGVAERLGILYEEEPSRRDQVRACALRLLRPLRSRGVDLSAMIRDWVVGTDTAVVLHDATS